MSNTRGQVRQLVYAGTKIPGAGHAATADSVVANGIVNAAAFNDSGAGASDYVNGWIYRNLQADPNRVKRGSVIVGSEWTHEQIAYTDALTDLAYEAVGWLHPDTWNECIRLALRQIYFEDWFPVTPWTDGDFISSSVNSPYDWQAAASGTSVTKDSTQDRGNSGKNSLVLTGAGYTRTSSLYVRPAQRLTHGADYRAEGLVTATYSLIDVTNNVTLFTDSTTARAWRHVLHTDTIPPNCYEVKAQLQTSSGVSVFDTTFGQIATDRELSIPAAIDEAWRLIGFGPAYYSAAISGTTSAWDATSRLREAWLRPFDYDLDVLNEDANPQRLQINRDEGLSQERDFWIYGMRAWSDINPLTDETSTTDAPEDLLLSAVYYQLALALTHSYPMDPRWPQLRDEVKVVLDAQRFARRPMTPRREQEVYIPGGRRGAQGGFASGTNTPFAW